jgi:hypothetical protein
MMFCVEQPCIAKNDRCCIVVHVDDILFCGDGQYWREIFLKEFAKEFKISHSELQGAGSEINFLKRIIKSLSSGLALIPGTSAGKVIELFELHFGKARMQTIPCDQSIQFEDVSSPLNAKDTYHFRSVIDTCLYLARDRPDLLFVEKELSGLRKLVGYLKMTSDICLVLEKPQRGQGRWKNSDRFWILESFSDSDWSSNQSRRRPTSSGMHMLNGCFLFGSSRTQRVISLSSCEAELHALVSTLCDDFFSEEMPRVFDRGCGGPFPFYRFPKCSTTFNAAGRWQNQTSFWQDSLDPAVGDGR